jgi:nickel transport protein
MSRGILWFLVVASAFCPAALAHDITAFPIVQGEKVRLEFRYGDPGDYQPIDKVRFVELSVYDAKATKISFVRDIVVPPGDPKKAATPDLRLGDWPAGTYVVSARYDNGFYIHDSENRAVATTKEWFAGAIDSAHYQKFSKALFHVGSSSSAFDRVLGHRLELIPLADPFVLKDGASLPVEVRFDGAPLADVIVEVGDDQASSRGPRVRTDSKGHFAVPLSHKGYFRISVDHRAPSKYPDLYSFDDYTASLVFER